MPTSDAVFLSQPSEHVSVPTHIEGTIPPELRGTLLRSGPGPLAMGPDPLNFFDGHALIAGISFHDGACTFRSRIVRTPLYAAESAAGKMTKRRVFTNLPSRWSNLFNLDLGNNAMHDVYPWGDRVVAGNDPGHFALDPATLETRGAEDWGGAAKPGVNMSPMPNPDTHTGNLVGYLQTQGKTKPDTIAFVQLDSSFKVVQQTPFHALATSPVLVHDHRATARFYVAVEQAARLSAPSFIWGARTLWESLTWAGRTATLLLVPKDGGPMVRIPLPEPIRIAFHVINAYDDGENVVVDLVTYDAPIAFSAAAPPTLRERLGVTISHGPVPTPTRFVVDPKGRIVSHHRIGDTTGEAPEVRDDRMGRPYRYAWLTSPGPEEIEDRGAYFLYSGVAKVDVETGATVRWSDGAGRVVSPPAFVARPGSTEEDDGWVILWGLTTGEKPEASVIVLDGKDPAKGPIARISLGFPLPGVSHTRWAEGLRLQG